MKQRRQNAILQIIEERCIRTQEELSEALLGQGFEVTQATVSRDIKELRLLKKPTAGGSRYTSPRKEGYGESIGRAHAIFRSAVKSVDLAMHTIVMHTMSGMADAAAISLETMEWPEILGTIAGDDTVLIIARDTETAATVCHRLREML